MMADLKNLLIQPGASMRDAMTCIERNAQGIVLVVDEERHLISTISDGDIRRAILAGVMLDTPIEQLQTGRSELAQSRPVVAPSGVERSGLLKMMRERSVRQIPLLDDDDRVVDLVTLDQLLPQERLPLEAVIMAGGSGTRIRPLTSDLPKPMLPMGDRPLIELIIVQLREAGIRRVSVATHYRSEKIIDHLGTGDALGVEISYLTEEQALGTAGALGMMQRPDGPLLVLNGDVLTGLDFRAMLTFHQRHEADLTVAVRRYEIPIPWGVVESEGPSVRRIREKPLLSVLANAGIYLLESSVCRYVPSGQRFNMTDLIDRLLDDGGSVVSFPIVEYWLDIGQHSDYEQAKNDVSRGRFVPRGSTAR